MTSKCPKRSAPEVPSKPEPMALATGVDFVSKLQIALDTVIYRASVSKFLSNHSKTIAIDPKADAKSKKSLPKDNEKAQAACRMDVQELF
jgi:hypothetical protein